MFRKVFVSFLIVAVINLTISCSVSSDHQISKDELILGTETIHELVLVNAEKITFNYNGGKLIAKNDLVEGVLNQGSKKSIQLTYVDELSWIDHFKIKSTHIGNPDQFLQYIRSSYQNDTNFDSDDIQITEVLTNNEVTYIFDELGGKYIKQKAYVTGLTSTNDLIEIDHSQILYAIVKRTDAAGSILASMGLLVVILMGVILIAAAAKQSCPFVYSFDGEKYVFDAEPLGGATTKGLERTELSKLEYLKPIDGKYKLMIKNEVPETQYIDEMSLLVVDHLQDYQVYADLECQINTSNSPHEVLFAKDEFGTEITDFVRYDDDIFWQTKLPFDTTKINKDLRHQLTFAFPKPQDKNEAKLIINAGTSLWGSQMIREMQTLYGDYIDTWYEQIDKKGIEKEQMLQFIEREELYIMNANVKVNGSWVSRASINGGGPFIAETRTYDLNLQNVIGDTLFIQFNIPYGFWTLNYAAIEYGDNTQPFIQEVKLSQAIDHVGESISTTLMTKDDQYYIMPKVGDFFLAEADAPLVREGYQRTIFLKTNGYYKLHLNKDQKMQSEKLFEIASIPGMIVKYSLDRFNDWETNYIK